MLLTVLNVVVGGLIMGGIYALISMGLSMQYGVARILNVSHGEFIMLGAFFTWALHTAAGINPLLCVAICAPPIFLLGFALHRTIYKRLRDVTRVSGLFEGNAMLVSFGLMFVIKNIALMRWGSSPKGYSFMAYSVEFGGAVFSANRLLVLAFAVCVSAAFYVFLNRSRLGKAIRAASQDAQAAALFGIKINRVMAICFGIGALLAGIAGVLLSMIYQINTAMGMNYTIIAIIVVVLGGLGSIPGSLIGGFALGLIGSVVAYIEPSLQLVAYYVIIMALLLVRPKGILGR
ncbi:MAG: branched-chain amino acid ABC transporter permease [Oscillospiraceae bacterium]|nr:branched-chain amino acid ABC transporter permease [Oscillospiraceae bacterium]